jgi:hypothetical protein
VSGKHSTYLQALRAGGNGNGATNGNGHAASGDNQVIGKRSGKPLAKATVESARRRGREEAIHGLGAPSGFVRTNKANEWLRLADLTSFRVSLAWPNDFERFTARQSILRVEVHPLNGQQIVFQGDRAKELCEALLLPHELSLLLTDDD